MCQYTPVIGGIFGLLSGARQGAHCLSMAGFPFWLSHCPQSLYQTLGSSSSTLASVGISDVSVHRRHIPGTGVRQPGSAHSRHQSPLSLQAWFYHKSPEVSPRPILGYAPLGSSDRHGQGIGFSILDLDGNDITCNSGLVGPFTGLCSTPSSDDRAVGVLPRSCFPVHISSSSLAKSPEGLLRPRASLFNPSSHLCPNYRRIHLWMVCGFQSSDGKGECG